MKHLVLLFVATLACLLAPTSAGAVASPGDCWRTESFNQYANANEPVTVPVATDYVFTVQRCNVGAVRIEIVSADTKPESLSLRRAARESNKRYETPWVYCRTSSKAAYLINLAWYTNDIRARDGEGAAYTRWALDWKRNRSCTRPR